MSWLFADVQNPLQISVFFLRGYRACSPLFTWVGVKLVSTGCETARTLIPLFTVLGFPTISAYMHCQALSRFLLQRMRCRIEMICLRPHPYRLPLCAGSRPWSSHRLLGLATRPEPRWSCEGPDGRLRVGRGSVLLRSSVGPRVR